MKINHKISLRARIAFLTGAVIITVAVLLTFLSIYNADRAIVALDKVSESSQTIPTIAPTVSSVPAEVFPYGDGITAAISTEAATVKQEFNLSSYWYLFGASVVGMLLIYWVAGRALRPVKMLSKTVQGITQDNLKKRIPEVGAKDEIGELTNSFNGMLARLEDSFERQKRFSASVAHELKTPLATILTGIQVLRLEDDPSTQDCIEVLDTTEENLKRINAIIDDLFLMLNRTCNESSELILLDPMFHHICEELDKPIREKNMSIDIQCCFLSIMGNSNLIYRMFFNLIENAVKYNENGGKIAIFTTESIDSKTIVISDTGVGMVSEELSKIFEPFYRIDVSRSRKNGGVGLGLAIVKAIAEQHGFEINVHSTKDLGTSFMITI